MTYFFPCMLLVSRSLRCSYVSMASKRTWSKDTDGVIVGAIVEQVSSTLPIYEDTKLYLDKDIKQKWQEVNETCAGTFGEDVEDRQVYVNIQKSGLYRIACRYPAFPYAGMIHWIIYHTNPKMMTLSSVSGTKLATLSTQDYDDMYQMLEPAIVMTLPFSLPNNRGNSRDMLKYWVKETAHFRMTPNHIYKTKIFRKVYQYLVIFACQLSGQVSTEPFLRVGWSHWTNWLGKEDHATDLAYWLISWRNKSRRLDSHPRVCMKRFTCRPTS